MLYKYEIACQQAGLSEEKTAEIRRMFNAQYQKLYREKVTRNRLNCEVWHMEDLYGRDGEKGTYDEYSGAFSITSPALGNHYSG